MHDTVHAHLAHISMHCGMMVVNWGQHAFVDENDPNSNFWSSITLMDVDTLTLGLN